jgi:hypothetical protein
MNQEFLFLKLLNGDQMMATKISEDSNSITIEFPMQIRMFPRLEPTGLVEQITSGPYCQFTEDKVFTFNKKDILFAKELHELMIPHYQRMLVEHEREVEVDEKQAESGELESDETVEHLSQAVEHIQKLFQRAKKQEESEKEVEERFITFVEGNITKH